MNERAIIVEGLNEPPRSFLQRCFGCQVHDRDKPCNHRRTAAPTSAGPPPSKETVMDFGTWPRVLVVDVEGNGAQPPDLVEVAAIPMVHGSPVPSSARSTLLRPPNPITPFATRVHRITNQDVATAPTWEQVGARVHADLEGTWIAAHNAHVDYGVLLRHMPQWRPAGVLDTLRLARATCPAAGGYSLDALIDLTGIDLAAVPGQRHRAGFDAHATALLLLDLAAHYDTWDALLAAAVPPKMPGASLPATPNSEDQTLW
ncbi:3'-5' exonuclease [Kitasatospora sp. NBC_01302]|uniref:3'-5' exonuclease n=1 Tax=Kitasatospora sp. NBC_01302 TaxID=2903575 RepID=UPI002E13D0B8|nr:3'-5' exonuclease [Kitasatospora sp. NBC_01302]